ncbi:MAG: RNA-binding protein [bacterium]|nr:RNA-binding protein [bacterium]
MDKRLFIAGLPFSFGDRELSDLFSQFGKVESATVIMDRETGRSKGFGFVEMSTSEEANAAIGKLNDSMVEDRKIVVNVARPREERPRDNFNNNRGGGRSGGNRW